MNVIAKFERKHFPNIRKKTWYKATKAAILFCLIPGTVPIALCVWGWKKLSGAKLTRKGKPDIVLKNIVAGFSNLIGNDPEIQKLATERAEICAKCPFAVKSGIYSIVVDNKTKNIQGMKCGKCGCNLSAKVRSIQDTCPLGKW